jgi:hypothetical protein
MPLLYVLGATPRRAELRMTMMRDGMPKPETEDEKKVREAGLAHALGAVRRYRIRPAASMMTVMEAMEFVEEVTCADSLMAYLVDHYDFWRPTKENVTIRRWYRALRVDRPDRDWDTHLVCVDGNAAVFTDGMIPGIRVVPRDPDEH